jgi:hypothetical protein
LSEALAIQVSDIDKSRMMVHLHHPSIIDRPLRPSPTVALTFSAPLSTAAQIDVCGIFPANEKACL